MRGDAFESRRRDPAFLLGTVFLRNGNSHHAPLTLGTRFGRIGCVALRAYSWPQHNPLLMPFSLSNAAAALSKSEPKTTPHLEEIAEVKTETAVDQAGSNVKSKTRSAKPMASEVVKRGEIVRKAISKYTGLPKGPGSSQEQDDLLNAWTKDNYPFPTAKQIAFERQYLERLGGFSVAMGRKAVARRTNMISLLSQINIQLTDADLCTLALGRGRFRKAYWVVCSLYGHSQRSKQVSKTDTLTTIQDGDSEDTKEAKQLLAEQAEALKACQREWQRKVTALRDANAKLLQVMEGLQVSTDELRDRLRLPPVEDISPVGDETFQDEGDEDEEDDDTVEASGTRSFLSALSFS